MDNGDDESCQSIRRLMNTCLRGGVEWRQAIATLSYQTDKASKLELIIADPPLPPWSKQRERELWHQEGRPANLKMTPHSDSERKKKIDRLVERIGMHGPQNKLIRVGGW